MSLREKSRFADEIHTVAVEWSAIRAIAESSIFETAKPTVAKGRTGTHCRHPETTAFQMIAQR